MNGLLVMLDILRARRGPQDLPADPALAVFWTGVAVAVGLAIGVPMYGATPALIMNLVDVAVLFGFVALALRFQGFVGRQVQTYTAMVGTGAILGLLMALLTLVAPIDPEAGEAPALAVLGMLALLGWLLFVYGHILHQALELSNRMAGVVIALGFVLISSVITQGVTGAVVA